MKECKYCKNLINNNENICRKCGKIQNNSLFEDLNYNGGFNNCSNCGSSYVKVKQLDVNNRSVSTYFLWIILTLCTLGLFLLIIPFIKKKKKSYFVCEKCGHYWNYE